MDAEWEEEKAAKRGRRQLKLSRERMIVSLLLDGHTPDEIADKLGEKRRTMRYRCAALGVKGGQPNRRRVPATWIKVETRNALQALATQFGVSAGEIVELILRFQCEDGAVKARALLRNAFLCSVDRRAA
jgi:hypothetical protein